MTAKIENLTAKLVPFDFQAGASSASNSTTTTDAVMSPIYGTGGLVLPYTPSITEAAQINYDKAGDLVHTNEQYYVYKSTDNRKINLSNVIFTADTYKNALYMLAAIHFFRTYSLMDYGAGRTGRPPSPMWFSAYGNLAYDQVPVLLNSYEIVWNNETDLVGVPNPGSNVIPFGQSATLTGATWSDGTPANIYVNDQMQQGIDTSRMKDANSADYTWVPMKLEIGSIQLTVQHTPKYWRGFNLADFKSGAMLAKRESNGVATTTATTKKSLSPLNYVSPSMG